MFISESFYRSSNSRYFRSSDLGQLGYESIGMANASGATDENTALDEAENDDGSDDGNYAPMKAPSSRNGARRSANADAMDLPDALGTPLTRGNSVPAYAPYKLDGNPTASFFSPAIAGRSKGPSNMSPALSEMATPSHCNCKKSKCLKL